MSELLFFCLFLIRFVFCLFCLRRGWEIREGWRRPKLYAWSRSTLTYVLHRSSKRAPSGDQDGSCAIKHAQQYKSRVISQAAGGT